MNLPDCTLITRCFSINNMEKTNEEIVNLTKSLLETECYLVLFTDKLMLDKLSKIRNNSVSNKITKYILMDVNEIITSSKFDLVLKVINMNPFNTNKYGWIDCCVGENFSKLCSDYKKNMLCEILNKTCKNKFYIQIVGATNKKYINEEHIEEYYSQDRCIVSGGFFITGKNIGKKILTELYNTFKRHTNLGYANKDEMYYLPILEKYNNKIEKSYGDYNHTLNNFLNINIGIEYIYHNIIKSYQRLSYHYECIECCETILNRFENYEIEMNNKYYFLILVCYYISMYYIDIEQARDIVLKIYNLIETNVEICNEYHLNRKFYNDQFSFVIKKPSRIIFLILANDTEHYLPMQTEWRKYMKSHQYINCYFIKYHNNENEQEIFCNEDTIYVKGEESLIPGCLDKTLKSIEFLLNNKYEFDYILRTNLSSVWNLHKFYDLVDTIGYHAAAVNDIARNKPFLSGAGLLLSRNTCKLIINNKDEIDYKLIDDLAISWFLLDKNIKFDSLKRSFAYSGITDEEINNRIKNNYHLRSKNYTLKENEYINYMRIFINKIYGL